jgi:hypothetical protein
MGGAATGKNTAAETNATGAEATNSTTVKRALGGLLGGLGGGNKGATGGGAGGALGGLLGGGGAVGGATAQGTKTPKGTTEDGVATAAGKGATEGMPTCADDGTIKMTFHQVSCPLLVLH